MKLFAVIGNPISHSKSPLLHNNAYKQLGIDACYTRVLLENETLLKSALSRLALAGANITVPFKEEAFRICDEVAGVAKEIEAVNTIICLDGKLIGHNTDALGFLRCIDELGKFNSALVLGAGGTAKAAVVALKNRGFEVAVLNRSKKSRSDFFENLGVEFFTWSEFEKISKEYELIVNTTSAGLLDEEYPAPKDILTNLTKSAKAAYDVIYSKQTPFLTLASKQGLKISDGANMLAYQAYEAFKIFFELNLIQEEICLDAMKEAFCL